MSAVPALLKQQTAQKRILCAEMEKTMNIYGLQKLTLLDYPGKIACTVFTGGCNFRCPFCHNASLVLDPASAGKIEMEEFFSFLEKRKGVLDGVCITGGEPLLHDSIAEWIIKIREKGFAVKLDTNGSFPDKLKALVREGLLDYVAMDIKNSKAKYAETIGIPNFDLSGVEESVRFLLTDAVPYEFRTTVTREFHTKESLLEAARWIAGCKRYFLQSFSDSGDLLSAHVTGYTKKEMENLLDDVRTVIPEAELRGI